MRVSQVSCFLKQLIWDPQRTLLMQHLRPPPPSLLDGAFEAIWHLSGVRLHLQNLYGDLGKSLSQPSTTGRRDWGCFSRTGKGAISACTIQVWWIPSNGSASPSGGE